VARDTNTIELCRCYSGGGGCRVDAGDHDNRCTPASAAADYVTDANYSHVAALHSQADLVVFVVSVAVIFRSGLYFTLLLTSHSSYAC